jgi:hypothetical protein
VIDEGRELGYFVLQGAVLETRAVCRLAGFALRCQRSASLMVTERLENLRVIAIEGVPRD